MTSYMNATLKSVDDAGSWLAIASSDALDRDGEIVAAGALTWEKTTVPVYDGHSWVTNPDRSPIGRAEPFYRGRELHVRGRFASTPDAQLVRTKVREGIVDAMSVVFVPKVKTKNSAGVTVISDAELLSVDFVGVGSQRDALVLSARAYQGDDWRAEIRAVVADALLTKARADIADAKRCIAAASGGGTNRANVRRYLAQVLADDDSASATVQRFLKGL